MTAGGKSAYSHLLVKIKNTDTTSLLFLRFLQVAVEELVSTLILTVVLSCSPTSIFVPTRGY